MNLKFAIYFILSVMICAVMGCKKLVDVDPPITKLVTASVFTSDNTAIAAQLSVYTQLQSIPWNLATITALSSDEFKNYSTYQSYIDLYENNLNSTTDGGIFWPVPYNLIYQENAILANVQASGSISNNTKKLLLGEAEFGRAFLYFCLVNLFGDVPLVTSTNYAVNSTLSRTPKSKVYAQIITDLNDAISKLSANYLDATDTVTTVDRVRPTKWAAYALLARAYLYNGQYDSAAIEASNVINNTTLFGLPPLNSVFLKNSLEAIWQIMPPPTQLYTIDGNDFILTKALGGAGVSNNCAISTQLLNAFEVGDLRKTNWISSYVKGSSVWYFPYKYKDNSISTAGISSIREYTMVLRVAEQYLIRAEANAQQNDLGDAINDIDVLRKRAGLGALSSSLNQAQVLAAVAHERQVELFTEGQRWLDLKRTNVVDSIMGIVTNAKGSTWNTNQQLYPLPITDIQSGINLVQNPGY